MSVQRIAVEINRRAFLRASAATGGAALLSGCTTMGGPVGPTSTDPALPDPALMYAPMEDGGFSIPAVPYQRIEPQFWRQIVRDPTGEAPGTLIVDISRHFLFLVRPNGYAIRYGVGLGRAGFGWSGSGIIRWKQAWPKWTPPAEMIARDPSLEKFSAENGGQPPGLENPLGARALYIFQGEQDTLYRVHGSPEWQSIGKSVSSGCVRLIDQDIIDLYDRVPNGSPLIVTGNAGGNLIGQAIDSGIPEGSVLLGRVY